MYKLSLFVLPPILLLRGRSLPPFPSLPLPSPAFFFERAFVSDED